MTFLFMNGFMVDIGGMAGDMIYGQNDNFYDPCSQRVTVGIGEKVPVVVRASAVTIVGQSLGQQNPQDVAVQVTVQGVSVRVAQPSGASNPIRSNQPQAVTQQQVIAVNPVTNNTTKEFVENGQDVGITLLTPKLVDTVKGANAIKTLAQQIAVEVNATQRTAQILSQSDDFVFQSLANQLRANQGNIQQILQKAGVEFDKINDIKNAMFSSDNALLQKALQRVSDKVPQITKTLQTAASNIAVRACG